MPSDVRKALEQRDLTAAYRDRPSYQQNDYIGWIARAKHDDTRQRRISQMIDELLAGDRYMNMSYKAVKRPRKAQPRRAKR
jgi:uncharacterized protein YdeI (YjbR/CyaY-like superfamily)